MSDVSKKLVNCEHLNLVARKLNSKIKEQTNYLNDIDYDNLLAFDTSEITFRANDASPILDTGRLDSLILEDSQPSEVSVMSINDVSAMSTNEFQKTNFFSGQVLKAEHLNNIENGIIANEDAIENKADKEHTHNQYLTEHQDISNLATKTELGEKQDTLVSGENIKTINGTNLLGNGNVTIEDLVGKDSKLLYDGVYHLVSNYGINTGLVDMNAFNSMITSIGSGVIVFNDGEYLFPDTIVLPSNITLKGSSKTILKLTSDSTAKRLIYIGEKIDNVKLIDLTLEGYNTTKYCPTAGDKIGIEVYKSLRVNLERLNVTGFDLAGLKATYMAYITSTQMYYKQMQVSNCRFETNYYGMYLGYRCEYTQVSNTICGHNNIGCFCGGGNNLFTNSMFNNNTTGFIMESEGMQNPAHGGASNCGFNHNTSVALKVNKNVNGFTFMGCQFFHGAIQILQSKGTVFDGCIFGTAPLTSTGTLNANVISNSYFLTDSVTMLENNDGSTYVFNCLPDRLCLGVGIVTLTRIFVTYNGKDMPVGLSYDHLSGIVVTAVYSDGTTEVIDDYTISGNTDNLIVEGVNTITVSYADKTDTFNVVGIVSNITSISATYNGGDVLIGTDVTELNGINVIAKYENGDEYPVSDYTISGNIAEGENIITVTYNNLSTTFIVIGTKSVVSISAVYNGNNVAIGSKATELTEISVTATYTDGSSKEVTGFEIVEKEMEEGNNEITITYMGQSTTINVIAIDTWKQVLSVTSGAKSLASDLYIANKGFTIEANQPFDRIVLPTNKSVVGETISNVNVMTVNADTDTILEHIIVDKSAVVGTAHKYNGNCVEFDVGIKEYDVPVYLLIEADRDGVSADGKSLSYGDDGATNSGVMINLATTSAPKVGDVLTMDNKLYVNHIVYYTALEIDDSLVSISATYSGGNVEFGTKSSELTGITVIGTYTDGSTKEINEYSIVESTIVKGDNEITITYMGQSTTINVIGVDSLSAIASITTGGQLLAGGLYIGCPSVVVPANTEFNYIVFPTKNCNVGDVLSSTNVYIVRQDTNEIIEHIIDNQSATVFADTRLSKNCIGFDFDAKQYEYPVYLLIESERDGNSTTGKAITFGSASSSTNYMVNEANSPAPSIGDILSNTATSTKYYIDHIIYYKTL